jgi:RNA polymerase-binding protein DksA
MATTPKPLSDKHTLYARVLNAMREELLTHRENHRQQMIADRVPEDEVALASQTLMEDLAIGSLQREEKLLAEVEGALRRLDHGRYGVCEICGTKIPERRLRALPWTRHCLDCAEALTSHWKN